MARRLDQAELKAQKTLAELARYVSISRPFLFGSYVSGTPREDSDIDLAAFSPSVDGMSVEEKVDIVARVGFAVREPVEIHLLPERMLSDSSPADFAAYVATHGRELEVPKTPAGAT